MNEELRKEEIIDMEEQVDDVIEVEEESKFKRFIGKAGDGVKKHGKKVAGIAAIAAVGLIGYALGHKSGEYDSDYIPEDIDDTDGADSPYSDIVDVTEE